jgi:L-asparaginase
VTDLAPAMPPEGPRLSVAVFSGATATIQNTAPLVTSNQARRRHGLPPLTRAGADALRPQRLAAPVTVYIEAYSAHPLERDAESLYAPPDGYVGADGSFSPVRRSAADRPVHKATLTPDDGLYLLPYMARQADGTAWDGDCTRPGAPAAEARQTFLPDASRLFEEVDRFGLDGSGHNNLLSRDADFTFFRAAPSGGYTRGLAAAQRTDEGEGDVPAETRGEDFFSYSPRHLAHGPARPTLARVTNTVQEAMDSGRFDGAIWLEGSPAIEETLYWLNLLVDTDVPLCGNSSQRPHGALSNDGDRNLVDSVAYLRSRIWAGDDGRDCIGAVLVQEEQVFTAREVQKGDARPGGYVVTGGHGGIVASIAAPGAPTLTFRPTKRHTSTSAVNLRRLPQSVTGVRRAGTAVEPVRVAVKDEAGRLLAGAVPKVTLCKFVRYGMDDYSDDPAQEVEIAARVGRNLDCFPLAGFVLEGNAPFGRTDESMTAALHRAALSGMPVVRVGRGNAEGIVRGAPDSLLLAGSNLTATKARLLLMACLLRFGATPPAADPGNPTAEERAAAVAHLRGFQQVFDTH